MIPSAISAKPEYAFKTVTSTGMSAPPIAADVVQPCAKESAAFPAKHAAPIAGAAGAMVRKVPIHAIFVTRRPLLMTCRPGRTRGFEDIRPASFRNARMEPATSAHLKSRHLPVKVIPPMSTPRYAVVR